MEMFYCSLSFCCDILQDLRFSFTLLISNHPCTESFLRPWFITKRNEVAHNLAGIFLKEEKNIMYSELLKIKERFKKKKDMENDSVDNESQRVGLLGHFTHNPWPSRSQ